MGSKTWMKKQLVFSPFSKRLPSIKEDFNKKIIQEGDLFIYLSKFSFSLIEFEIEILCINLK